MLRFLSWSVLPVGLVMFLFFTVEVALNRPTVRVGMDGQCLSILMNKDDREIEVGCDAIDLEKDRHSTQHVLSPAEIEEIEQALARK